MKKVCLLAVCFVFLMQAVAFAETKIAVFNTAQIMQDSQYGQEIKTKLDAKFKARGDQLQKERQSIANLKKQIESKAFDDKTMQDKIMELRRRGRDWNEDFSVYQKSIQNEKAKLIQPVTKKFEKAIGDYCTANGYTIGFDAKSPGLAYIGDGVDITDVLIKEVDKLKKSGQ